MAGLVRQLLRLGALSSRSSAPSFSAAPTLASRPFTTIAATAVKEEAPVKEKKVKGPKRPASSYSRFVTENYKKIAAQHPDKKGVKELASEMGKAWTALSTAEKAKYQEAAAAAKAEYEQTNPKPPASKSKRAPSAYNNFMARHLSEVKDQRGIPVQEAMSVLAAEWKTKSDAEKAQYKTA